MLYNILEVTILRNREIFLCFQKGGFQITNILYIMIVEYREIYLKKWQPLFVTPADCALPFFPSLLYGVKNVTVHVIYQIFPLL